MARGKWTRIPGIRKVGSPGPVMAGAGPAHGSEAAQTF